jgi:hypothetical protein
MRWHGLAVLTGLFALGLVSAGHVPRGLALKRHRASGLSLCLSWFALAASGYALSYLVPEPWRPALGLFHAGLGVAAFGLGALHAWSPRPGRSKVEARSGDTGPRGQESWERAQR